MAPLYSRAMLSFALALQLLSLCKDSGVFLYVELNALKTLKKRSLATVLTMMDSRSYHLDLVGIIIFASIPNNCFNYSRIWVKSSYNDSNLTAPTMV